VAFAKISIKHIVRHATNRMAASRIHPLMFYAEQSLPHLRSIVS
jgi:hypothetical protein